MIYSIDAAEYLEKVSKCKHAHYICLNELSQEDYKKNKQISGKRYAFFSKKRKKDETFDEYKNRGGGVKIDSFFNRIICELTLFETSLRDAIAANAKVFLSEKEFNRITYILNDMAMVEAKIIGNLDQEK